MISQIIHLQVITGIFHAFMYIEFMQTGDHEAISCISLPLNKFQLQFCTYNTARISESVQWTIDKLPAVASV